MKKNIIWGTLALALAAAPSAHAGDVTYPGSMWSTNGTLSPVEKSNIISLTHVEQGVQYGKYFELFGQGTLGADSKRYDWNNKVQGGAGVRLSQSVGKTGVVRVSVQYVKEYRPLSESTAQGVVLTADTYFSWGR